MHFLLMHLKHISRLRQRRKIIQNFKGNQSMGESLKHVFPNYHIILIFKFDQNNQKFSKERYKIELIWLRTCHGLQITHTLR